MSLLITEMLRSWWATAGFVVLMALLAAEVSAAAVTLPRRDPPPFLGDS